MAFLISARNHGNVNQNILKGSNLILCQNVDTVSPWSPQSPGRVSYTLTLLIDARNYTDGIQSIPKGEKTNFGTNRAQVTICTSLHQHFENLSQSLPGSPGWVSYTMAFLISARNHGNINQNILKGSK